MERYGRCVFPSPVSIDDDFSINIHGEFSKCDIMIALSSDLSALQETTISEGVIHCDSPFVLLHIQLFDTPRFVLDNGTNLSISEPSYQSIQFPMTIDSMINTIHIIHNHSEINLILNVLVLITDIIDRTNAVFVVLILLSLLFHLLCLCLFSHFQMEITDSDRL